MLLVLVPLPKLAQAEHAAHDTEPDEQQLPWRDAERALDPAERARRDRSAHRESWSDRLLLRRCGRRLGRRWCESDIDQRARWVLDDITESMPFERENAWHGLA